MIISLIVKKWRNQDVASLAWNILSWYVKTKCSNVSFLTCTLNAVTVQCNCKLPNLEGRAVNLEKDCMRQRECIFCQLWGGMWNREPSEMLLYHKNILRFGCMHSVLWHGSETEFAVEFFRAECNKNNCFPQGKMREKIFQDLDLKNWYIRCGIVMVELHISLKFPSLHSQINIIVYWDVWMWKKDATHCVAVELCGVCAFWNCLR